MHHEQYTDMGPVPKESVIYKNSWILIAGVAAIMVAVLAFLNGCQGSLLKPVIIVEKDTPVLVTERIKVQGAVEQQPGSGQWDVAGYIEIPAGYVCFPADTGAMDEN